MRRVQIGVIGSMADLHYSASHAAIAETVGEQIAAQGGVLVFGIEKDGDSLSASACQGAARKGGLTVGVAYDTTKETTRGADIVIPTGLARGGGREFTLVLACDAVISLGGGSGTLNEMTVAYQAGIPIVALRGLGGWSDKMAGQYLDDRKRQKVLAADTAEEAVRLAFGAIRPAQT